MTKKYNVIRIEDYYLIVDQRAPNIGEYCYETIGQTLFGPYEKGDIVENAQVVVATIDKRIDKLPLLKILSEKEMAANKHMRMMYGEERERMSDAEMSSKDTFYAGYDAATKTYSEEDIKDAISMARQRLQTTDQILDSLKLKPITAVELELAPQVSNDNPEGIKGWITDLKVDEHNIIHPINVFYE